jgi:hypothetical protein
MVKFAIIVTSTLMAFFFGMFVMDYNTTETKLHLE